MLLIRQIRKKDFKVNYLIFSTLNLPTSLEFQHADAAYHVQNTRLKVWKPETAVLYINAAANSGIA